jgi:cytochrome c-type biogenesis protein
LTPNVSFPLAFVAGLLSFISPCVLPLVPVYLGYLSGSSLAPDVPPKRWRVFSHALFFVLGFVLVFVLIFGLPTTMLGAVLQQYGDWIAKVGGAVLILFGLHTIGLVKIPFLDVERRWELGGKAEPGYARSLLVGVTFAAGWTPCIGPLLGTVITLSFSQPSRAVGLLTTYALGLAVPFLLTAALLSQAVTWLKRLNRYMRAIQATSAVLMIGVGVLLISGASTLLNTLFLRFTPEWLLQYL